MALHEDDKVLVKILSIILFIVAIPILVFAVINGGLSQMLIAAGCFAAAIVLLFLAAVTSFDADITSKTFTGAYFEIWSKIHGIQLLVVLSGVCAILYVLAVCLWVMITKLF